MFSTSLIKNAFRQVRNVLTTRNSAVRQFKKVFATTVSKMVTRVLYGIDWVRAIGRKADMQTKEALEVVTGGKATKGFVADVTKSVVKNALTAALTSVLLSALTNSKVLKFMRNTVKGAASGAWKAVLGIGTTWNDFRVSLNADSEATIDFVAAKTGFSRKVARIGWFLGSTALVTATALVGYVWFGPASVVGSACAAAIFAATVVEVVLGVVFVIAGWNDIRNKMHGAAEAHVATNASLFQYMAKRMPLVATLITWFSTSAIVAIGGNLVLYSDSTVLELFGWFLMVVAGPTQVVSSYLLLGMLSVAVVDLAVILYSANRERITAAAESVTATAQDALERARATAEDIREEATQVVEDVSAVLQGGQQVAPELALEGGAPPVSTKKARRFQRRGVQNES